MASDHAGLWTSAHLQVVTTRSGAGQTAEVRTPGGDAVAACDDPGALRAPDGALLAHVPLLSSGRQGDPGQQLYVQVNDPAGGMLGGIRLRSYSFTPRASRIAADVEVGPAVVARLEAADGKGDDIAITGDRELARLVQTGHDRGLRRSVTSWDLTVHEIPDTPVRMVVVAGLVRYAKLKAAVGEMAARGR